MELTKRLLDLAGVLTEEIEFADAKDQDYPIQKIDKRDITEDQKYFFSFWKDEVYAPGGLTHGVESHAIKHLDEFDYSFFMDQISLFETILLSQYESGGYLFINKNGNVKQLKKKEKEHMREIESAKLSTLINTLDMIQDKKFYPQGSPHPIMNDIENKIFNEVILPMGRRYEALINNIMNNDKIFYLNDLSYGTTTYTINTVKNLKETPKVYYLECSRNRDFYFSLDNRLLIMQDANLVSFFVLKRKSTDSKDVFDDVNSYLKAERIDINKNNVSSFFNVFVPHIRTML